MKTEGRFLSYIQIYVKFSVCLPTQYLYPGSLEMILSKDPASNDRVPGIKNYINILESFLKTFIFVILQAYFSCHYG